jgi:TMEM175 potassium channel family protein
MGTNRMEAFSDGVIAIIITVMVLELRIPSKTTPDALIPVVPALLTYLLSFLYLGIYWSNHHHLLHTVQRVSGGILWANLHLLFWLSLIPFTTGWMGENHFAAAPTALYGIVLLLAALAWWILQWRIIASQGTDSLLRAAIGRDWKGKLSPLLYLIAIAAAAYVRWASLALYALVALLWLIPDRRIERALATHPRHE